MEVYGTVLRIKVLYFFFGWINPVITGKFMATF
jgi:hypothetical protein